MIIHAGADGALAMNEARRESEDGEVERYRCHWCCKVHARSAMSPRALAFRLHDVNEAMCHRCTQSHVTVTGHSHMSTGGKVCAQNPADAQNGFEK